MDRALLTTAALAIAFCLDTLIGDPRFLPHPVRLLGKIIELLEVIMRRVFKTEAGLKTAGLIMVLIVAGGSAALTLYLLISAYRLHLAAGFVFETYLFFTVLAGGDLRNHVLRVNQNLTVGDLPAARVSTAMLVSRDTGMLEESGLSRAALESLFENSADGLVAPLAFAALGGPVAAVFFKAVSTMDSMIGYKTVIYKNLGFCAAKLDDLLSYIPARLTALLIILAGFLRGRSGNGWQVLREDYCKHDSPNSAWPEAAAAGVLGIRFGGTDLYHGELVNRPVINASGREARMEDLKKGLALFRDTAILAFILLLLLSYALRSWEALPF
jgi:adenosylcobinamide-phosphate synthase